MSEQDPTPSHTTTDNEAPNGSSRCRRTVIASVTVLLISALVVYWLPSNEEMGLKRAQQLLDESNPADALFVADKVLNEEPDSVALKAIAIKAVGENLASLTAKGDFKGAERWLARQLEEKPYLAPLSSELMRLDARDTVAEVQSIPHYADKHQPEPLQQFIARHQKSPEAPYFAESLLRSLNWREDTRYWLLSIALDRGHEMDEQLYSLLLQQLNNVDAGGQSVIKLLQQYDAEKLSAWASRSLNEGNVMAFKNAWIVLEESGDSRLSDPYYQSLHRMISVNDIVTLDQSRRVLPVQGQSERQKQILAFLEDLVTHHAGHITNPMVLEEINRMQNTLKQQWQ